MLNEGLRIASFDQPQIRADSGRTRSSWLCVDKGKDGPVAFVGAKMCDARLSVAYVPQALMHAGPFLAEKERFFLDLVSK